jgi:DNA polymerase I-like protein with 3'-5' exonuclease and polymerase domains
VKEAGWLNMPMFPPANTWQPPVVAQLPSWTGAKRVCLDVECRDDDLYELGPGVRRGGYVCGVAFAIEDGPASYLPVAHEGGGNLNPDHVWNYLRDCAETFDGDVVFNMAPYDLDYLWENKVEFKKAKRHLDVQNAEPLLDEFQKTYGLDAICGRRGLPGKDECELREHAKAWGVDPKTGLWRLHSGAVGRYAEQDVRAPLGLLRVQEKDLEEQGLLATFDLESRVTCPLVRMTRRGLRVDLNEMNSVEVWAKERLQNYIDQIDHLTGIRIGSISNGEEVARALRARGLDVPTKIHGGTGKKMSSVTKLWLQQQTDEVALAVVSGREFAKLLSTYVEGFRKHLVGEHKDRIHPSFKQMRGTSDEDKEADDEGGARFGRCSTRHPNVQAQMKRSKEIQKRWRKVLVADEGKEWVSADFSQQEPRWTIHYSEICRLPGSLSAGDRLRNDPLYDCYQMLVELVKSAKDTDLKKLRDDLKEVYLGRCYGMGGGKLAEKLRLPTVMKTNDRTGYVYKAAGEEAQAIIDRFDRGVPYVKALARRCTSAAQSKGYILGVDGRHIRFELMPDGQLKDEHKALNKLIQYAAAWQTKMALVQLDDEGFPLQLTVHDEFDYSEDNDDRARHMAEVMCEVHRLRVPSRVDVKKGKSYGDLQTLCTVTSKGFDQEIAA